MMWAFWPRLRYVVSNGVTLCKSCHDMVTGKEKFYEKLFKGITRAKIIKRKKKKWKPRNPYSRF